MAGKILITGASGFIGRFLVEEALAAGLDVYAGIRASSNRTFLTDARIHVFPFDMSDPDQLHRDLKAFNETHGGFQYVIHNAAVTRPNDVAEFISSNAEFTREFARMLMETQPELQKFVFMSSLAALGPGDPETMIPIAERQARRPITPYGHSKLLAERYIHEIESLPYIILRPTGVYGPGDEKFALRVISMIKRGVEVTLGPVDQLVSFVHVRDVAAVAVLSCTVQVSREDFNISDGGFYHQTDFNNAIRAAMPKRTLRVRIPSRVLLATGFMTYQAGRAFNKRVHLSHMKFREVVARNWKVDVSKARKLLGYAPMYNLDSGLRNVIETLDEVNA
jgi:nucleoside-diphosphate-sugar epimerase